MRTGTVRQFYGKAWEDVLATTSEPARQDLLEISEHNLGLHVIYMPEWQFMRISFKSDGDGGWFNRTRAEQNINRLEEYIGSRVDPLQARAAARAYRVYNLCGGVLRTLTENYARRHGIVDIRQAILGLSNYAAIRLTKTRDIFTAWEVKHIHTIKNEWRTKALEAPSSAQAIIRDLTQRSKGGGARKELRRFLNAITDHG